MDRRMFEKSALILVCAAIFISCAPSGPAVKGESTPLDPIMGDWRGYQITNTGMVVPMAVQVIALGGSKYRINSEVYFDSKDYLNKITVDAEFAGGHFTIDGHPDWQVDLADGVISGRTTMKEAVAFELTHVVRLSPTLGAKPTSNALVLFDGKELGKWEPRDPKQKGTAAGWKVSDGIMEVKPGSGDIMTKQKFSDFQLHIEFRLPFMPDARGQARGNSGVYLQGRYEVQVLDSYGLKGEDNECGGIYKVSAPAINMCAPPGQWQTYDITFEAPRFDDAGKKINDAVITVIHNGIVIHKNLAIPGPTGGAVDENLQLPGALLLQDHGNLVQYRNVWLVESKN